LRNVDSLDLRVAENRGEFLLGEVIPHRISKEMNDDFK
jgi:hypothetical protein